MFFTLLVICWVIYAIKSDNNKEKALRDIYGNETYLAYQEDN